MEVKGTRGHQNSSDSKRLHNQVTLSRIWHPFRKVSEEDGISRPKPSLNCGRTQVTFVQSTFLRSNEVQQNRSVDNTSTHLTLAPATRLGAICAVQA